MVSALTKQAIFSANNGDWQQAIEYNLQILQLSPSDISAMNRLGRAYLGLGDIASATQIFDQVLTIDKFNLIAQKNLQRISKLKDNKHFNDTCIKIDPGQFLKEPGTAKVVALTRLASQDICLSLNSGEPVHLKAQSRFISIHDGQNRTIGKIPEDVSYRLVQLIKNGYSYTAYIKSATPSQIQVLIHEVNRPNHLKQFPSFPQA